MKKYLLLCLFLMSLAFNCAQDKQPLKGETNWQKEQNAMFKDATKSPLKPKDRRNFTGLDFFPFDSSFVVKANLVRTPDSPWFKMKTTTDRVSEERIYGTLSFVLSGDSYQLNVYQGKDNMSEEGFEDYLFLPFLDNTNGDATYGGGRYIDLRIPAGNTIIIDFNQAYSPYCAYNEDYSCPIVPRVNYLNTEIRAGVKSFDKL